MITPDEDRGLWTRSQLEQRLAGLLAGMAAEEIVFDEVTTGSSNDLEQATSVAASMVQRYGMGREFGLLSAGSGTGMVPPLSQQSSYAAEREALSIVSTAHALALSLIEHHRDDLERLAERLLEIETIEGTELHQYISGSSTVVEIPASRSETGRKAVRSPGSPSRQEPAVPATGKRSVRKVLGTAAAALNMIGRLS